MQTDTVLDPAQEAADLDRTLAAAEQRYRRANPVSERLHAEACRRLPGGSTRATAFYPPFPLTLVKGEGAHLRDADGHSYVDFLGDYTAGVYGHDGAMLDEIFAAIREVGMSLSGPTRYEAELADLVCARFPSCEQIRFCNSGTEANIFATALARRFTGRDSIVVFEGAYHGGALMYGTPEGALNIPLSTVKAPYNDVPATRALIDAQAATLAAVLVEPMMGSGGCIPADPEFLAMLREETARRGILLIFDEVANSRLSASGLQGVYGISPDMTILGKYIGGGFSFGAFGGRADIMALLDLRRPDALAHPGTFNNNVSSMIGGTIGLKTRYTAEAAEAVNARGDRLRQRLDTLGSERGLPFCATGIGGAMNMHFCKGPIRSPADIPEAATAPLRRLLHFHLLDAGFYTAPRGLITVSMAVTDDHVTGLLRSVERFLDDNADVIGKAA